MTVERGIKRVLIALSVVAVAGWVVFVTEKASELHWSYYAHHTTAEAYCDQSRRIVYESTLPEEALSVSGWSIPGCIEKVTWGSPQLPGESRRHYEDRLIDRYLDHTFQLAHNPTVTILRTEHRWLREYVAPIVGYTLALSGASLALLWGTFYALRWVVRGFRRETR